MLTVLLGVLFLAGCGQGQNTGESGTSSVRENQEVQVVQASSEAQETEAADGETSSQTVTDMFSDRDYDSSYDESQSVSILLNGSSVQSSSDTVSISGSTVTISEEGTYILSGTLDNGMIIVNAENTAKIQLVLDNAVINSNTSAAIYVMQADKVFCTLAPDSENSLSNGGEFTAIDENNIDAVVFSKEDLTFNGEGTLTVDSPAGHGIVSKDDLAVTGGEYRITAAGQGMSGKDSVRGAGGTFTISSGKDGIHAENTEDASLGFVYISDGNYDITAEGDGIGASGSIQIDSGSFTIEAGGGSAAVSLNSNGNWEWSRPGEQQSSETTDATSSVKGIKAAGDLLVNGGTFTIDTADDALHSNSNLTINGGTWQLSTGDDGLHADETVSVIAGDITVTKSYEGIEGKNIALSGGNIDLVSSDDGLNGAGGNDQSGNGGFGGFQGGGFDAASDSSVVISGGILHINASGDGVDSNGSLKVTGGETYVSGPADSGNGALDYNGEASISGGIFIAAGGSGMAQNFTSSSTQGAMLVSISGDENDTITLSDSSGQELLQWTADKAFSSVVISCPEICQGETYTVTAGGVSQSVTMDALVSGSGERMDGMGRMKEGPGFQP